MNGDYISGAAFSNFKYLKSSDSNGPDYLAKIAKADMHIYSVQFATFVSRPCLCNYVLLAVMSGLIS